MIEQQNTKTETTTQKKILLLSAAIGDWTTYQPLKSKSKKVKTGLYHFDRISEDGLNKVLHMHYNFISKVLESLKKDLKIGNKLFSVSVEQNTYFQFVKNIKSPQLHNSISINDFTDSIVFCLDLSLVDSIINYLLASQDTKPLNRALTEAEEKVIKTTLQDYLNNYYKEAVGKIGGKEELKIISSPQFTFDKNINPSDTYIVISFEISLGENAPAKIKLAYPGTIMQKLLENIKNDDKPLNISKLPPSVLNKIFIPAKVILGTTWVTTQDLNNLEIGDVVELESTIDHAIPMTIGEKTTFLVQPGFKGRKNAIRLIGLKREEKIKLDIPVNIREEETEEENIIEEDILHEEAFDEDDSDNEEIEKAPEPIKYKPQKPLEEIPKESYAETEEIDDAEEEEEEEKTEVDLGKDEFNEDDFDLSLDDFSGEVPPPPSFK
ncbi:MAG: FliM/FliN family flagellar motor switch protein [bacterium]